MSSTDRTDRPSTNRPSAPQPAPSTDRPTATYPTADHLAHRERLADLWADATPTAELPVAGRRAPRGSETARPSRARRHLRAALAGVLAASALLTGLSLYAADGISSSRQAATEQARSQPGQPGQPAQQQASPASPDWVTHDTGAAYDRTDPHASPLDLPRCTTAPDTPMPCLAHVSADSHRVVVLEEDASLTALVLR